MKLSIETYVLFQRFGEEKAFEMIKNAGFDCVDYSFYWLRDELSDKVFGDGFREHAREMRALLDKMGLACNQAHAPFDFDPNTDTMDMSNENYAKIVKSFEFAAVLGAENIVVHAIPPVGDESVLESNYRYYKSFEPYLEKYKIHLAIENLFCGEYDNVKKKYTENRFGRPEAMNEIIDRLDSEWYVCCLDVGHATITEIEPQDFIMGMGNGRLRVLHVQDNDYENDRHMLPYIGRLKWDEVTKALKETGYDGELTFEIFGYLGGFADELLPAALQLAEQTGRHLIDKMSDYLK